MDVECKKVKKIRKVQYEFIDNRPTLIITQKFKVKQSKVQYIVKLNTNLPKLPEGKHQKVKSAKKKLEIAVKERIVPICLRRKCCHDLKAKTLEIKTKKHSKVYRNIESTCPSSKNKKAGTLSEKQHKDKPQKRKHSHSTGPSSKTKKAGTMIGKQHKDKPPKLKHSRHHETHREKNQMGLSPISMSPLPDRNLDQLAIFYEDISDNSFLCNSDDDLDTLIKRTKEREQNLAVQNMRCKGFKPKKSPVYKTEQEYFKKKTPIQYYDQIEANAEVFSSEMDVSIHSSTTVVLAQDFDTEAYSPTASSFAFKYHEQSKDRFEDTFYDIEEIDDISLKQESNPNNRFKIEKYSPAINQSEEKQNSLIETNQDFQKIFEEGPNLVHFTKKRELRSETLSLSMNTKQNTVNNNMPISVKQEIFGDDYTNCSNDMKISSYFNISSTGYSDFDKSKSETLSLYINTKQNTVNNNVNKISGKQEISRDDYSNCSNDLKISSHFYTSSTGYSDFDKSKSETLSLYINTKQNTVNNNVNKISGKQEISRDDYSNCSNDLKISSHFYTSSTGYSDFDKSQSEILSLPINTKQNIVNNNVPILVKQELSGDDYTNCSNDIKISSHFHTSSTGYSDLDKSQSETLSLSINTKQNTVNNNVPISVKQEISGDDYTNCSNELMI